MAAAAVMLPHIVAVPRKEGERAIALLSEMKLLDCDRRYIGEGPALRLPLLRRPSPAEADELAVHGWRVWPGPLHPLLPRAVTPYDRIRKAAEAVLPCTLTGELPRRWEKVGTVLLLRIPSRLRTVEKEVARLYADVLECTAVLKFEGGTGGIFRRPAVKKILGGSTETVHTEGAIRYRLDPAKVLFSSGNVDERQRMGRVAEAGETAVDLFAGIGYFSLPMAVHGGARVFSCEINPVAFRYLRGNIALNRMEGRVTPLRGDCRKVAPRGVADRVVMGYLRSAPFLPLALRVLKPTGGTVHYHEGCPEERLPDRPLKRIGTAARRAGFHVVSAGVRRVKSYAPGVWHVVVDAVVACDDRARHWRREARVPRTPSP